MPAARQLRLLLWKDFLIRKRKLITLGGIVWATAVMLSLYIVRVNVDNVDYPTCQFPARALPSAGVLTFLQSFICSVNNECSPLDKYEEVPSYENSKLTQLQKQFTPLLYNETVLNVASSVPDALKLLATLANIVDEPTFVDISKNGLRVRDLFSNPSRVRRYIISQINISGEAADSVMESEILFQGIMKGDIDRCSIKSMQETLKIDNVEHFNDFVTKLCSLTTKDIRKILLDLIVEVNFGKYVNMIGSMYNKLSGDDRIKQLGATMTAVLRMTNLQSFVPPELMMIFQGKETDFSYFNLTLISKLLDQFKPTFSDTQAYKTIRELADTAILGVQYLNKYFMKRNANMPVEDVTSLVLAHVGNKVGNGQDLESVSREIQSAVDVFGQVMSNDGAIDVFDVLSKLTNFIYKWLPEKTKHDVLFYATLLSKLLEAAHKVVTINMNIEELTYNASVRNPEGIKILASLPAVVVGKGFDALADAQRIQILTSKITSPGQVFCDKNKIQGFFQISSNDAAALKSKFCSDPWKAYVQDLIRTFGVFEIKDNINSMASLLIQETFGKDTNALLYTIEKDFVILKDFYYALIRMNSENKPKLDWEALFNVKKDSEFMKVVYDKSHIGKQVLITVHGAIAKEIVKQNSILDFKISPVLIDATTLVVAFNKQLDGTSRTLVERVQAMYPGILRTVLMTSLDEDKTYKCLSTHSEDIMCRGVEKASSYLSTPQIDKSDLVDTLCNISVAIEDGVKKDSPFGKAIENIRNATHGPFDQVDWTKLINGIKSLYLKLDKDYTYVFQFSSYGMDGKMQNEVNDLLEKSKKFWFGKDSMQRSLHLSLKLGLRLLDVMDRDVFNITNETWLKVKNSLQTANGPLSIFEDFVKVIAAISRNESYTSDLPPITVQAVANVIPNIPHLIADAAGILANDDTEIEPIISVMNSETPWPCTSISDLLDLTESSKQAVKGLETLLCLDNAFQSEWAEYLEAKNFTNSQSQNASIHTFLKFSSMFDSLIKDSILLKKIIEDIENEESRERDPVTLFSAWKYAGDVLRGKEDVIRNFFGKLDTVLNAINTTKIQDMPLNYLWEGYRKCSNATFIDDKCKTLGRAAWKSSLRFLSVTFGNVAADLYTYFHEINEPNSNLLQMIGFTKRTGLYMLYDRMPEFMGTLLNSYWDYGFMNQIRRAAQSQFWDCEAVVNALTPPPGSSIDSDTIRKVQPYICPSILYWISLPRGDNTLLDLVSKPQYFFYTLPVDNLTSNFEDAFDKANQLSNLLKNISNRNETLFSEEDLRLNTMKGKLESNLNAILSYTINKTDTSYMTFNDINTKQFAATVYLTRVVAIVNKVTTAVTNLNVTDILKELSNEDTKKIETSLYVFQKLFQRRPVDAIALHFDVITNILWKNDEKFTLLQGLKDMCNDLTNNDTSKDIINELQRTKVLICTKDYETIYNAIQNVVDDFETSRQSLLNLVNILQNGMPNNVSDISQFLRDRKQMVFFLKQTIKYSYDLGIPVYLKYLQSSLQHYNVILSFATGENWWKALRDLYNGKYATKFFDSIENSFVIVEDIFTNLDQIHLVRLLRDINLNNTDALCLPNITMSDYIPDRTGLISSLKDQFCMEDKTELYKELPLLVFASQGYDSDLKLSKDVNYTTLNDDIGDVEAKLDLVKNGPAFPMRPDWVTDEKLSTLRQVTLNLLSQETVTKISFGLLTNVVDAGTLFLNNSQCTLCSQFTIWFKQLNLQLFKKQEYDNLLCHLDVMNLDEVHHTLKNDFHWDMAFKELMSTRNYTKYELNKSINELLDHIKLYLLSDLMTHSQKLSDCLAKNVSRNEIGNATLFVNVFVRTMKLIRAELPHLKEIEGIEKTDFLNKLHKEVAHNLDVEVPLKSYLKYNNEADKELKEMWDIDVNDVEVNLRTIQRCNDMSECLNLHSYNWESICKTVNCSKILDIINSNLNNTLIEERLPTLQTTEFWRFTFISNIMYHVEGLLSHTSRIMGVASSMDLEGLMEGRLAAMLDFIMRLMVDDTMDSVLFSLQSIVKELRPVIKKSHLETDIEALAKGLKVMQEFKKLMLEKEDLKVEVSALFSSADRIESGLSALGINNTNFWSIGAPRVQAGYINLKPIITPSPNYRISTFVCQSDNMSKVIVPANIDVVTLDDVFGAIIEQFCSISDSQAKDILPILMENVNFSYVIDKVSTTLLSQLFSASNLTEAEGANVLENYPKMTALLPMVQNNAGNLSATLAEDPLFQSLADFNSVGGLLSSSKFLASAGNMLCGKPFMADNNKFYKAITETADFSKELDPMQLDVLPTDFCRTLYKDILSMDGGKIVWSYVKPLIMGRILYTPSTPMVNKIIGKANSTFAHMYKLTSLVHSFANAFSSIDNLAKHREGLAVLRKLVSSPMFSELRASVIGDAAAPDVEVDVEGLFDEFGDLKSVGNILRKASDLLHCINLDRFHAMPDEQELAHEAVRLTRVNEFSAGLVFMNVEEQGDNPIKVEYKIRMDIESVPTTTRIRNQFWTPGPEASFLENMRYFRGFVQIQDTIDNAIIQLSKNNSRRFKREDRRNNDKWAVYTQQTPYPCYRNDYFQASLYESQAVVVAFFFSLLFTVASAVRFIVTDKETGNTMLMSVMGVNLSYHTLSWFVTSYVELIITALCVTVALAGGGVLPRTDVTLLFVILCIFGFSVLMFCYMISKLFTSASSAAVTAALAYLTTFMPYVIILSLEAQLSITARLFTCLSMSTSFSYIILFLARSEAAGSGARWADLMATPRGQDVSIGLAAAMMILDGLIYLAIGCLIDRYYGIKSLSSNITHCTTSNEKAGVSIVNVTKIFGERSRKPKIALDNVSVELQKGQITTLLGHNGAGKTTLINILTGMLKPTKGHVTIRSAHRTRIGVCPQRNVLFDCLTAREHVSLYSQLKSGGSSEDVREEVESMLNVLSLGPHADHSALALSGGTRRRLCVALAFVGRPELVSLDEPAAGVDPTARRDIWSMILKLKEDRTVLLTTHHLDEAEFLSDQVVIMHKGQIHTMGSPMEIKRSLGNGYKLTVMYPSRSNEWDLTEETEKEWEIEQLQETIEEKTKNLLAVVRDVVKNAQLVDVNGLEVEIMLPFYDSNGLNNDFQRTCATLESHCNSLGMSSFSMDCSSLEQVFCSVTAQADGPGTGFSTVSSNGSGESPSKSASSTSVRLDSAPLVDANGTLRGTPWRQFLAIMRVRYLHYIRNKWLLFLLIVLPSLFVTTAMAFSMIRPPADNEVPLRLHPDLYAPHTEFLVPTPSIYSKDIDPSFAERIMDIIKYEKDVSRNWTTQDSPTCKCETRQICNVTDVTEPPEIMVLPDIKTLNDWLITSQEAYIEKRYGGFTSSLKNNITNLIAWYNNKGHHALPSFVSALNTAIFKSVAGNAANITTYTHPLKISKEQLSKSTLLQHVADAGISGMLLVAYSLVTAGAAVYLVSDRTSQQKRLQLLSGVSPAMYWTAALAWDMLIIVINILISVCVLEAFGFPVFVARNNLPAICLLLLMFGYSCGCLIHLLEKLFTEPSLANMVLFCANVFVGLSGITLLLILDIISESEKTDNARWVLHKIFMLSPQFVLGDALLEIAKNTVQAQVLERFGMDTYQDPFNSGLLTYHFTAFILVGTLLLVVNLAVEYDYFEVILARFRNESTPEKVEGEMESPDVIAEKRRVHDGILASKARVVRLPTIGNINAGFIDTEGQKHSIKRMVSGTSDAAACIGLHKTYGTRPAVKAITLGLPRAQCTALLGENGAGKSTTFAMLTGETRPTSGMIYIDDSPVTNKQLCSGLISYCPQSDALDPLLTVRETLSFYCRLRGIDQENEVIKRTVEMFELDKYSSVHNGALSGGNKRKLCAAIAFMGRTPLVLLDEPTSGMDPMSRSCVTRGVRSACSSRRAVLLSTHALEDARRLAARVALMRSGRLCALGDVDDCLNRFGVGYAISCRLPRQESKENAREAWRRVLAKLPHAKPRDLNRGKMHFVVPTVAGDKNEPTRLSEIFRLMAELQSECDVEDYTINQTSLEEMFLNFSDKSEENFDALYLEPLPSPQIRRNSEELNSITSL